jgi:methionyl aminopeptidase
VREYVGHGIGRSMHEAPQVPNFGDPSSGPRLRAGMTLAIEPMLNIGGAGTRQLDDGWTVVTASGGYSAHYENTVLVTADGPDVLTVLR